jgi:hypothetical protein
MVPMTLNAIGRELRRLGVRKATLATTQGERLTFYEIAAPPASNVVPLDRQQQR